MAKYNLNDYADLMQYEYEMSCCNYENDNHVNMIPKDRPLEDIFPEVYDIKYGENEYEICGLSLNAPDGKIKEALLEVCKKEPTQRDASHFEEIELSSEEREMFQNILDIEIPKYIESLQQEER